MTRLIGANDSHMRAIGGFANLVMGHIASIASVPPP
jgi:hypothetical protein